MASEEAGWVEGGAWEAAGYVLGGALLGLAVGTPGAVPVLALYIVVVAGIYGGRCVVAIGRATSLGFPALLGMLIAGILARNLPGLREGLGEQVDAGSSAALRTAALSLILARAGLGLDMAALRRLKWTALKLAALPCFCEAATVAGLSLVFFDDFTAAWAILLGFVVAAVSPAVVVPSILTLQDKGYGTESGIPTLLVAAAALDDVFSLAGFGVAFSFALRKGSNGGVLPSGPLWADIVRAPLELAIGWFVGWLGASAMLRWDKHTKPSAATRAIALALVCGFATFSLKRLGFTGASALATLAISARVADVLGPLASKEASAYLNAAWNRVAQPSLFALLGAAVDLQALSAKTAGLGLLLLCISGAVRVVVSASAVSGTLKKRKEKLFVALAWLPKATVQAAVGAAALDAAQSPKDRRRARVLLSVAVVAILFTAPLGALAIAFAGPKLLDKKKDEEEEEEEENGDGKPNAAAPEKAAVSPDHQTPAAATRLEHKNSEILPPLPPS